jgi:hypothetical protein
MTRLNGTKTDRTKTGRFAAGNSGGPGRPRRETERSYLAALSDACTLDDWGAIVQKAVQDATEGDATARAWLASYLVGRPESPAATLHALAVEAESGTDRVAEDASLTKLLAF